MPVKCVIIGDVNGEFVEVLKKLTTLHAKNSFAFAIIAGELFARPDNQSAAQASAVEDLLNGKVVVPLPTYFCLGKAALSAQVIEKLEANDGELCENLIFLGKRTTIKTSEGIRICALGGTFDADLTVAASKELRYTPSHSAGDANSLKGANSADILLTSEWPADVLKGSKVVPEGLEPVNPRNSVAELCAALKPKYHFVTSPGKFFEREPFFHAPEEGADPNNGYHITRFIALAPYGNPSKQKWIYAFSVDEAASNPLTVPQGTTASPLPSTTKKRPQQPEEYTRYASSSTYGPSSSHPHKRRKGQQNRQPPPGPSECFFCLSNPNLSTHLITSIGDNAYMTTAKGPLTTSSTFSRFNLPVPGHMLIIPLAHTATLPLLPDVTSRADTLAEMRRFFHSTQTMLASVSKGKLGCVVWEVRRSEGIHTHWQVLPVPVELIQRGLVEAAFRVEAENEGYPAFEVSKGGEEDAEQEVGDAFDVWISSPVSESEETGEGDGGEGEVKNGTGASKNAATEFKSKRLTLPLTSSFRFDLQFGRRVMAKLLGLEKRLQWRDCAQSVEEETKEAEGWKELFKGFDFTLE